MNSLTPEITKHLRHLRHRKQYLERKVAKYADRPAQELHDTAEMFKREIAALNWVLGQYPTPPPKQPTTTKL